MKNIIPSCIIGISIIVFGGLIKSGMDHFTDKNRVVTVKGLSEQEVPADLVTWTLSVYETGNDLPALYDKMTATNGKVTAFLKNSGIEAEEISITPPEVDDRISNRYSNGYIPFNYKLTTRISVRSKNVSLVRAIIDRQGELIRQGIALGGYNPISYEYTGFQEMKPKMLQEAIVNARESAEQFAKTSGSHIGRIITADQGQFSITGSDERPDVKKIRVVSTVKYALKN